MLCCCEQVVAEEECHPCTDTLSLKFIETRWLLRDALNNLNSDFSNYESFCVFSFLGITFMYGECI